MPVINVIKVQELSPLSRPLCITSLCMRPTKTPFNWDHPQHSWSITEYVATVANAVVCLGGGGRTCMCMCIRICRWPAVCLHLQEAQTFGQLEPKMLPSVVLSARWIPKTPLCSLQTLMWTLSHFLSHQMVPKATEVSAPGAPSH